MAWGNAFDLEIEKVADAKEPVDLPRLLKILRDANYQGWFIL